MCRTAPFTLLGTDVRSVSDSARRHGCRLKPPTSATRIRSGSRPRLTISAIPTPTRTSRWSIRPAHSGRPSLDRRRRRILRYTFDISKAGGKGGTWYFWGRAIVPQNESDFLVVEGIVGEPVLPASPPYPGTSSATGFTNARRDVDENLGPPWTWGRSGHGDGHTRELQDGKNTMYLLHRQGTSTTSGTSSCGRTVPPTCPPTTITATPRKFCPAELPILGRPPGRPMCPGT